MRLCAGRVVAITGAGRGVGRGYALEFARQGAKVVVNDLGGSRAAEGSSSAPADDVVAEVRALGGEAVANYDDVADWTGAQRLVQTAIDHFGKLDVLVNNAGILRDRTVAKMSEEEWDAVVRVHLRGTAAPTRWAAEHWKARAAGGEAVAARLINTTSSSGLFSRPGQANYAAAKAGIASLTLVAARELARYGVTANAIYPTARTRMTEDLLQQLGVVAENEQDDPLAPEHIAPIVVWLGSVESSHVTGRVFGAQGGRIVVAEGWRPGPSVEREGRWDPNELGGVIAGLLERAAPIFEPEGSPASVMQPAAP